MLFVLGLVWLIFASVQDLRTHEIANWVGFSLILFALGFRFFTSLFLGDFSFFLFGLVGLGAFFILGNVLYYARMFAGGDAKLMIALGPLLALASTWEGLFFGFGAFFFLFLLCGAVYGLIAALFLSVRHFSAFKRDYAKRVRSARLFLFILGLVGSFFFALGFFVSFFFVLGAFVLGLPYLYLYAKAVDSSCMLRTVSSRKLTEGDWLAKAIRVDGKTIQPHWEGLSKKDVLFLRRQRRNIMIKQGIAFVPVFFISYLIYFLSFFLGLGKTFW